MNKNKISCLIAVGMLVLSLLACNFGAVPAATLVPQVETIPGAFATEASAANNSFGVSGACANPYLPVISGATWNYKITGPVSDTFTRTILSTETGGFTDQDIFGTGVNRQGQWNCDNGNLIALDLANGNSASVNTDGVSADFHTTESSGVTIPLVINSGDEWIQATTIEGTQTINETKVEAKNQFSNTCKAIGIESVMVEAGTFDAMRFDCQTVMNISMNMQGVPIQTAMSFNSINWYAENIGLLKTVSTGEGLDSTIELISYNIP